MAVMITTTDNPFDPRDNYKAWDAWDRAHGYNTTGYLARVLHDADDVPDAINDRIIEQAIDEIIDIHDGEMYKKLEIAP